MVRVQHLREFEVADVKATRTITVKQLLNHSSGIAGDYFPEDQDEDGPHIARYVMRCSQLPLVHPVGNGYSYCNAAFAIAGRLVEVVSGKSWFDAVEEWIFQPLDMKQSICRPADVIRFRTALGHFSTVGDPNKLFTCSGNYLSYGLSPAGATPTMAAADLLSFGRAHLEGGLACTGKRWLSEASVFAMQTPTNNVPVTSSLLESSAGLGWIISKHNTSGLKMVTHNGGTNGQCSILRLFPDHSAGFVVLMNCKRLDTLESISNTLTQEITGIDISLTPSTPFINLEAGHLRRYIGHYLAYVGSYFISWGDSGLKVSCIDSSEKNGAVSSSVLRPLGDNCFEEISNEGVLKGIIRFVWLENEDAPSHVFSQGRLFQRQK